VETIQIGDIRWVVAPEIAGKQNREAFVSASEPKRKARQQKHRSQLKIIFDNAKKYALKNVRIVGQGGLIDRPIDTNGWRVMPIDMYEDIIPPEVMQDAELLTKGIPIKGFLVAEDKRHIVEKKKPVTPEIHTDWGEALINLCKVVAAVAVGTVVITNLPLILFAGALGSALVYDPLLIAVTEENEWVCVAEWWH
jgi:hypothetical protein